MLYILAHCQGQYVATGLPRSVWFGFRLTCDLELAVLHGILEASQRYVIRKRCDMGFIEGTWTTCVTMSHVLNRWAFVWVLTSRLS